MATKIEEVLKEMRERRARAEERYCDPDNSCGATGGDVLKWADALEAAMREKDAVIVKLGNGYAETGRVLDAKDAKIERLTEALQKFLDNSSVQTNHPDECEFAEAALAGKK